MSKRRRRKKKKVEKPKTPPPEEIEEEDDEAEEEGEEAEPEIIIPLVWRLADENDAHSILKLIQDAEVSKNEKKKDGEEEGEEEDVVEEEEDDGEEEETGEYDENGDPIKKPGKKEDKEPEEPLMSLDELLLTTHPLHEYNLLTWSIMYHHPHLIRKLISYKDTQPKIFCFTNPKCMKIVKSWTRELETLNKLKLEQAMKIQQEADSEGEDSENEEEGEERPDFFETRSHTEKMSVAELQSLCKLGLYEGPLNDLHTRHGFGRAIYPNGDVFIGSFKDNMKHGYGVYLYENGGFYIGFFYKNMREGYSGYMKYPDGSVYQGSFVEDLRRGYGRFRYVSGDFYYGQWSEDLKEGYGVYEFHLDGSFYDGKWKSGKFVSGLWQMKNGVVYSGEFGSGQPFGMGIFYYPRKGVKQVGEYRIRRKKRKKTEGKKGKQKQQKDREEEEEGEKVEIIMSQNKGHDWNVHSNENMTEEDFKFLKTKKKDRMVFCVVTGRSEVGKTRLLGGLEKVMHRHPSIFFLRRVTTRQMGYGLNEDKYTEPIPIEAFGQAKEQGGLYYDWEANGFGIGLPAEQMFELKKLRGTKIVFVKVERVTKELMERLKADFGSNSREKREVKLFKIIVKEEVFKKRLNRRGLSEEEIGKIIEQNQKEDEIEAKEGLNDEIIVVENNSKLSKSVKSFVDLISRFDHKK